MHMLSPAQILLRIWTSFYFKKTFNLTFFQYHNIWKMLNLNNLHQGIKKTSLQITVISFYQLYVRLNPKFCSREFCKILLTALYTALTKLNVISDKINTCYANNFDLSFLQAFTEVVEIEKT
jgi:hypothetical protein